MYENLPGKTDWESKQYRKDRDHRVAAAQAYHYLARRIEADDNFPLPPGSEALITAAAAAMESLARLHEAAGEVYAKTQPAVVA
jgi:hypothetical protein